MPSKTSILSDNIKKAVFLHSRANLFTRFRTDLVHGRLCVLSHASIMQEEIKRASVMEMMLPYVMEEKKQITRFMIDSDTSQACENFQQFVDITGVDISRDCYHVREKPHPSK